MYLVPSAIQRGGFEEQRIHRFGPCVLCTVELTIFQEERVYLICPGWTYGGGGLSRATDPIFQVDIYCPVDGVAWWLSRATSIHVFGPVYRMEGEP